MKIFDTCALLESYNDPNLFKDDIGIVSTSLRELENIKTSGHKDPETKYKARKISRRLDEEVGNYTVLPFTQSTAKTLEFSQLDPEIPDNQILGILIERKNSGFRSDTLITNDICLKNIARIYNVTVESAHPGSEVYKGYKRIVGTAEDINRIFENGNADGDWHTNEYLVFEPTDGSTPFEKRWDGEKFVDLVLPPSSVVKGWNNLQRCALDALYNDEISIVAIPGGYGSGKTKLVTDIARYKVSVPSRGGSNRQGKILLVREPVGEGHEIGFLPGDVENKTGEFFKPIIQQLEGEEQEFTSLQEQGIIECQIPYYMKGDTYNNTIILCDEAEDFTQKIVKLVGTRVGKDSRIFFAGDYKQSLVDSTSNNPLMKMCASFAGDKDFACVYLEEDVRSSVSKKFANLYID